MKTMHPLCQDATDNAATIHSAGTSFGPTSCGPACWQQHAMTHAQSQPLLASCMHSH